MKIVAFSSFVDFFFHPNLFNTQLSVSTLRIRFLRILLKRIFLLLFRCRSTIFKHSTILRVLRNCLCFRFHVKNSTKILKLLKKLNWIYHESLLFNGHSSPFISLQTIQLLLCQILRWFVYVLRHWLRHDSVFAWNLLNKYKFMSTLTLQCTTNRVLVHSTTDKQSAY